MTAEGSAHEYPLPAVTADSVTFSIADGELRVLLIQRRHEPFRGQWAIPGGFIEMDETLRQTAVRELQEETGFDAGYVEQIRAFGDPGRDPRMRVISVAFLCLQAPDCGEPQAADDAADARWCPVLDVPPLAFDHATILAAALEYLRVRLENSDLVYHLLPEKFTLTELQTAHELILGQQLDKRNFRRKLLQSGTLSEVGQRRGKEGRPARLYRYKGWPA